MADMRHFAGRGGFGDTLDPQKPGARPSHPNFHNSSSSVVVIIVCMNKITAHCCNLQLQLATGEAILRHGRLQIHQIKNYDALGKLVVNYTVSQKKEATK